MSDLADLAASYNTDKGSWTGYLDTYERYLGPLRSTGEPVVLFELGVRHGGSVQLWRDYLPSGPIIGLDLELPEVPDPSGRIHLYQGSQADEPLLRRIAAEEADGGFDVVIDDCAHQGDLALESFKVLFPLLKPGGVYFIEDWGSGYWPTWVDGARVRRSGPDLNGFIRRLQAPLHRWSTRESVPAVVRSGLTRTRGLQQQALWNQHTAGMVGFVKMLVDEVGSADVERGGAESALGASISELIVRPGVVVAIKSTDD